MSRDDSALGALIALVLAILGTAAVLSIIDEATRARRYLCPKCGTTLRRNMVRCPQCGISLRWA